VTASRRSAGAALILAVLVAMMSGFVLVLAPTGPARAAATCTAPQVAVAVNLRGVKTTGCANYSGGLTGWTLLQQAGFTVTGTDAYPDTFVCRINRVPNISCASTPSESDSWSYWHAAPGATQWTFSASGAASYHPKEGSADAWNLGRSAPPFTPQSVLPVRAAATHAPVVPPTPTPTPARVPSAAPATSSSPSSHPPTARATTSAPRASSSAPRAAPDASSSGAAAGTANVHPTAASQHASGSSAWPAIGGLIAVLVIAGGGGATAWRRRGSP
jgi:hypothetical protein